MKKLNTIFFGIILIMSIFTIIPQYSYATNTLMGDVSGDGKIDVEDVLVILRHISATNTGKNQEWILKDNNFKVANVVQETDKKKEEKLDVLDMLRILRYIAAKNDKKIEEKHKDWVELGELVVESTPMPSTPTTTPILTPTTTPSTVKPSTPTPSTVKPSTPTPSTPTPSTPTPSSQKTTTPSTSDQVNIVVKSIKFSTTKEIVQLNKTKTKTIKATILPKNATNKTITYSSSDKGVATVNTKTGKVTLKKSGTVTITAKSSNNKKAQYKLIITNPVTNVIIKRNNKKVKDVLTLERGHTLTLVGEITQKAGTNTKNSEKATLTYKSSNTKCATISATGKVKGISKGTTTITVSAGGKKATCKVRVIVSPSKIKLNKTNITLYAGEKAKLKATLSPSDITQKKITWKSSNTNVADVKDGVIIAKKSGTAKIIAKTENNIKKECTITVKEKHLNILFLGNSKTVYWNYVQTFTELATTAGRDVYTDRVFITSVDNYSNALSTIASRNWDYIVLQDQTENYNKPEAIKNGSVDIYNYAKSHGSPNVIMIYNVAGVNWNFNKNNEYTLATKYHEEASKLTGGRVAYTATAYLNCHKKYPKIKLFEDEVHQSAYGTYISVCCVYSAIYGLSPVGIEYYYDKDFHLEEINFHSHATISKNDTIKLQKIAAEAMNL